MTPTTTTEATPVAPQTILPRRPGGPVRASVPRLADDSPLAAAVADYRRLLGEHRAVTQEIGRLERERPAAEHADRRVLADALAAGKRDPGDKNQAALAVKIADAQRKLGGLADATSAAVFRLRDQVRGDAGARWRVALDDEVARLRETLDEQLAAAAEAFEKVAMIDASREWLRAAREGRSMIGASGLPMSVQAPKVKRFHISGEQSASNALNVLRDLARADGVPAPKVPPAVVVADDAPEVEATAAA